MAGTIIPAQCSEVEAGWPLWGQSYLNIELQASQWYRERPCLKRKPVTDSSLNVGAGKMAQ